MRFSICPSDIGANPFLVETLSQSIQVDLITASEFAFRSQQISMLEAELENRNKHIDELEKKMDQMKNKAFDSEKV